MASGKWCIACTIIPCAWSCRSLIHFSIPFWWWALTPQYCTLCFWSFALVVNEFSANLPLWHVSSAKLPYVFLHTSQKTHLPSWVQCNTDSFAWVQTTGLINGQRIWLPTCTYPLSSFFLVGLWNPLLLIQTNLQRHILLATSLPWCSLPQGLSFDALCARIGTQVVGSGMNVPTKAMNLL